MMNLKTVKSAADLPFKGIELVKTDKTITEVIIGGKLRIRAPNTYSSELSLLIEQPHEVAQRHRLTAKIDGFDPKVSYFEYKHDAERAKEDFEERGAAVVIELVEVSIDETGQVVSADPAAEAADATDIPI